jgi:pimeloyl-ACP methyl ester carboxylesterase
MTTAVLNGFEMYYDECGEGAPVVFIHGGFACLASQLADLPTDGSDWTWEQDFDRYFRFVAYDRRGCLRSSNPETGYDLHSQVRDLESLLDQLGIQSAHLIGSSAGGPITVMFAATRPHRTRSITLVGTGADLFRRDDPISEVVLRQIEVLDEQGAEAAFEARPPGVEVTIGVLWDSPEQAERGTLDQYEDQQRRLKVMAEELPHELRVQYHVTELLNIKGYVEIDLLEYTKKVRCPTLVLHGRNDRAVPLSWGQGLAESIDGAELVVFDDQSHTMMVRSAEARRRTASFIREIEGDLQC